MSVLGWLAAHLGLSGVPTDAERAATRASWRDAVHANANAVTSALGSALRARRVAASADTLRQDAIREQAENGGMDYIHKHFAEKLGGPFDARDKDGATLLREALRELTERRRG